MSNKNIGNHCREIENIEKWLGMENLELIKNAK